MSSQRDLLELHKLHLSFQDHMIILSKQKEEMERIVPMLKLRFRQICSLDGCTNAMGIA